MSQFTKYSSNINIFNKVNPGRRHEKSMFWAECDKLGGDGVRREETQYLLCLFQSHTEGGYGALLSDSDLERLDF